MSLAAQSVISDQDIRTIAASQGGNRLGQVAKTADGRTFQFGLSAGSLVAGKLHQGAVAVANHTNRTGVTAAIGASQLTFAMGATATTANQYAGGYLIVNAGTGAGQALLVSGNTSAISSGSPTVNLKDALGVATLVSDSKFSLMPHPCSAVVISSQAAATSAIPVGVPSVPVTSAYFGWFQTGGVASVLANGTPALGAGLVVGATTDGTVDVEGTSAVTPRVGYALITAVSTEYKQVYLQIRE